MGSPEFAVPALQKLAEHYTVVGVVTQPDRPAGRGRTLTPPPVKQAADSLGIATIQPVRLKDADVLDQLQAWQPDLILVVAYGKILRAAVLELPSYGSVNVHASLLPRWRGAAPIQAALYHGDSHTGVTIMKMGEGLDTGPILSQRKVEILAEDTGESLSARLAQVGAELLLETLPGYLQGSILPQAQDDSQATYAPQLKKEDGLLDFDRPAEVLARQVRAYFPWPGTFSYWQGEILKVHKAHAASGSPDEPGQRQIVEGKPAFGTRQGWLVLDEVQPAGKRSMSGKEFLSGARNWATG